MSNAIYKKDLHDVALAVAQGSKNYTDKVAEEILWRIGDYDITTQPDNTTASSKTVPTGATRCKIKRIYGLTEKFNPSVAYDNASTMAKTMPNVVYDFDCSIVYGKSEVSENLIVMNDVAETTVNGITYSVKDGVLYLNGTASANTNIMLFENANIPIGTYYYSVFTSGTYTGTYYCNLRNASNQNEMSLTNYQTTTSNPITNQNFYALSGATFTNYVVKPMLVKGTTAPTEFSVGFEGIHNLELSGLKVEGANKYNKIDSSFYLSPSTRFRQPNYTKIDGTYTISTNLDLNKYAYAVEIGSEYVAPDTQNQLSNVYDSGWRTASSYTFTQTGYFSLVFKKADSSSFTDEDKQEILNSTFMLNEGSTALPYADYVQPTTLPIDLSSILYNGSPLFEGNSLKAVGTAKDYITPYLAHKEIGSRAYQSGDEEDTSVLTDGTTTLYALATPIEVSIDWSSTLRGIQGYANGTITLQNTYNMDTANTITYNSIIKENCCAKIVQSRGGSVVKTINLPTTASDGYSAGSVNNVRDFTTNKRYTNVDKNYLKNNTYEANYGCFLSRNVLYNFLVNQVRFICSCYKEFKYNNSLSDFTNGDDLSMTFSNVSSLWIKDTQFGTDTTKLKNHFTNDDVLYYAMTDNYKTETSIDSVDNIIEVQPNDVLSFYDSNDNLVTVPSDLTYRIEVAR